ncbi:MAG: tetratricopeptide repeat protein [Proteobacteria bacterium]|nr:tetratricopeptide repeat protein [Pseudomonadota bacterium]
MLLFLVSFANAALDAPVQTALRRGDCKTVLELLSEPDSVEGAMARASCGDASALEGRAEGTVLEDYAALLLARAVIEEDPARAAELLEGGSLPGEAGVDAKMLRGRALVAQGKSLDARSVLRELLSGPRKGEALYWLAVGAEDRGDTAAAIDAYQSNWAKNVLSPYSLKSADRLAAMGSPVPDVETEAGRALALTRARALVKVYRAPEAIPLYDALASHKSGQAWTNEVAHALFKAKDYPRSMEVMGQLAPTEPGAYRGVETLYHYALGTSRTGDYATAAVYYQRLLELYPSSKRADTASYKLGYLAYDEGRLEDALPLFEAHRKRFPSSKHTDETLWFLGWACYRLDRLDEAEAHLDKLVSGHGSSSLAPQALYWKARIRGRQGDADGEKAALERLLRSYPTSGHAWYAADRLGRSFDGIGDVDVPQLPDSFIASHTDVQVGLMLADAGQFAWARERILRAVPDAKAAGGDTKLAMAHLLVDVGAYKDAQALARPHCSKPWSASNNPVATTACYPRPEFLVVEATTSEHGLHPLLPYAIMTAESALDPGVTSLAGARGLMQLMPDLADELHAELLPGDPYDADRLYVPGYNAWLGSTELGQLYTHFHGAGVEPRLPLAIAGYNGGSEAVDRWLSEYAESPDVDWFAENISYSETRRYTKRVLGYLMAYRWIYGDPE